MGTPWAQFGLGHSGLGRDPFLDPYRFRINHLPRTVIEMKCHIQRVTHDTSWAEQFSAA